MSELDPRWTAYLRAQDRLRRRPRCDDAAWGLEGELDGLLSTACAATASKARSTARRGACRHRGLMAVAARQSAERFRVYASGGWEGPILARLELAALFSTAMPDEAAWLADVVRTVDGGAALGPTDRKRLQRFRARHREDPPGVAAAASCGRSRPLADECPIRPETRTRWSNA